MNTQQIEEIEKRFGLPQLRGSEKQLTWARMVRASVIAKDPKKAAQVSHVVHSLPEDAVSDETAKRLGKSKAEIVNEFNAANHQLVIMIMSTSAKEIIDNRDNTGNASECMQEIHSAAEYQSGGEAASASAVPKKHYFGEKDTESSMQVWQTPKFLQARQKACEMIDSGKYGLEDTDFWILMNRAGNRMAYNGLIISHSGCLKINAKLPRELRYNPHCITKCINDYGGSLTYTYVDDDLYEVGEVNSGNCRNQYPNAMALKRLLDRVILKKSSLAEAGIYSEVESDDFTQQSAEPVSEPAQQEHRTVNAASQVALPEAKESKAAEMTLEAARNFRMPSGSCQGRTLGELISGTKQEAANVYVLSNSGSGEARQAAEMVIAAHNSGTLN